VYRTKFQSEWSKKYQASGPLWCQANQWLDLRRDPRSSELVENIIVMLSPTETAARQEKDCMLPPWMLSMLWSTKVIPCMDLVVKLF